MSDPSIEYTYMEKAGKCIYCGAVNPTWARAHVMPRLMGTFKNQPTLKFRVCAECDREVGQCEEILAKSSIEAVLLRSIGIVGRHERRSSPFRRGHSGLPPICMTAKVPGYEHEVRTEPIGDSHNVDIIPQLILFGKGGKREDVAIENPDCISLKEWEILFKKFAGGRVKDLDMVGMNQNQIDRIVRCLHSFGLRFDMPACATIPPFQGSATVHGSVAYDERYFRSLAKIAFHYFLLHSHTFQGCEPEFDGIRRFIRYGDGRETDFIAKGGGPIAYDLSGADRPPYYGHVLRTDDSAEGIAVGVLLFIGHDYKPDWHKVILSRRKPQAKEEFGHYYRYLDHRRPKQWDGVIEELKVLHVPRSSKKA
jgi:hypothetical protein